jgi:hypothetical protein
MLDNPPPSTTQSGSSRLTTCASARASRPACRRSAAAARASPAAARAGSAPASRARARPRRRLAPGRKGTSRCSPAGRTSTPGRGAPPRPSRAGGCGPTRPRSGCALPGAARPPPRRRRARAEDDGEHRAVPRARPSAASLSAKQLASLAMRTGVEAPERSRSKPPAVQPSAVRAPAPAGRWRKAAEGCPTPIVPRRAQLPLRRLRPTPHEATGGSGRRVGARRGAAHAPVGPRPATSVLVPPRSIPIRPCPAKVAQHEPAASLAARRRGACIPA